MTMTKARKRLSLAAVVAVCVLGAGPVRADSTPFIQGAVSALELCPQSVCGSAVFVGAFLGRVGRFRTLGTVAVAATHDPLPTGGACADITGGQWALWAAGRSFGGSVVGQLCDNQDNTYNVTVTMLLDQGGHGTLAFSGVLSHNAFPPTLKGFITQ